MAAPLHAVMVEHVRTLEDARNPRTRQHTLLAILVMAVCPLLTSGEGCQGRERCGPAGTCVQDDTVSPHVLSDKKGYGEGKASQGRPCASACPVACLNNSCDHSTTRCIEQQTLASVSLC
jgi:hypothetical protein